MATFKLNDRYTGPVAIIATGLFLCSIVLYFTSSIPQFIPVGLLSLASLWLCPWQITLALAFSAAGDHMGQCGNFIAQMGCFAAGHVFYITYFITRYLTKVEHDRKLTAKAKGYVAMVGFCTSALLAAGILKIAPAAPAGLLKTGVIIYSLLISGMLFTALLQRSSLFAAGAVLFVFSDFILSWNKFIEPIPHAGMIIMTTYFTAQWLLFIRASSFRLSHPLRLLRF